MANPLTTRIKALDGLRAFSVGLVLLGHAFPEFYPSHGVGVDVFFVISGFVITRHLLEQRPPLHAFYAARMQRLLPPALLVISVTWGLFEAGLLETSYLAIFAAALSFLNWLRAFDLLDNCGQWLGHYWSLSIEEQFYLVWPIILFAMLHRRAQLVRCLVLAALAVALWRLTGFAMGMSPERIYNGFDTRADGLLVGCLLAMRRVSLPNWGLPAALISIFFVGSLHIDPYSFAAQLRYPLMTILSAIAVAGCASGTPTGKRLLETTPMLWLGSRSYAVYLWHYPLMGAALMLGGTYGLPRSFIMLLVIVASLLAAEATYRLLEEPLRQARHRRQLRGQHKQQRNLTAA